MVSSFLFESFLRFIQVVVVGGGVVNLSKKI